MSHFLKIIYDPLPPSVTQFHTFDYLPPKLRHTNSTVPPLLSENASRSPQNKKNVSLSLVSVLLSMLVPHHSLTDGDDR